MTTYSISLNDELAEIVEQEMKSRKFSNRSEFFRDLVRTKFYPAKKNSSIEEISSYTKDYKIIKEREKDAEFMNIDQVLAEHNV